MPATATAGTPRHPVVCEALAIEHPMRDWGSESSFLAYLAMAEDFRRSSFGRRQLEGHFETPAGVEGHHAARSFTTYPPLVEPPG